MVPVNPVNVTFVMPLSRVYQVRSKLSSVIVKSNVGEKLTNKIESKVKVKNN